MSKKRKSQLCVYILSFEDVSYLDINVRRAVVHVTESQSSPYVFLGRLDQEHLRKKGNNPESGKKFPIG
ncbi:hypothetical protein TNCV_3445321 [Trichonephila clavipes]|nr:hypothetical protein TNCV_3445321 [Trichonephila clavipes]